jgi:hypothetical protein
MFEGAGQGVCTKLRGYQHAAEPAHSSSVELEHLRAEHQLGETMPEQTREIEEQQRLAAHQITPDHGHQH